MIGYLPEIYPDELVYSWFCRFYVHSGFLTNKAALQELLFNRSNNPSKEFIGHLNPKARAKISETISMDSLILDHTMFPQYARFIPTAQKAAALRRLDNDFCDAHHLFSILPRDTHEQFMKFCPMCAVEDRTQYGETYWHRKHQIRNIAICPKHGCKLEDSNISSKSELSFSLYPAEIAVIDCRAVFSDNPYMVEFAQYMDTIFDAPLDFGKDIPLNAILYHGLRNTKYLAASGKTRFTKRLADDMRIFYEEMGMKGIASFYQIQRLLLGNRYDFSVACQIAYFIGLSPEDLVFSTLSAEEVEEEKNSHYMIGTSPIDWRQLDVDMASAMEEYCRTIYDGTASDIGRPERVSERLVYDGLDLAKHQLENMPICRGIFQRYTESYEENWARRIIWAYQKLQKERNDSTVYWSDIRSLAGVKKAKLSRVIPLLLEYPGEKMVEKIVNLIYAKGHT